MHPPLPKTVIVIAGPTAVGKTSVAIEVATHFHTSIISADSRQCYKELHIGVARPTDRELAAVPHYFIASHSIHHKVTAATFETYALEKATELFTQHDIIVLVGGTGLYIKAFCEGLDEIPGVPEVVRNDIRQQYNLYGLAWLQQQVQQLDPLYYEKGERQNPQRLMRALEVYKATGRSIIAFQKQNKAPRNFNVIKIGLQLPKEQLQQQINNRVDAMIAAGLVEEVRSLIPYQHENALQTVGYSQLFDYFNGELSLADAIEAIKRATRQYAKRQLTWFRRDPAYHWFTPKETNHILQTIEAELRGKALDTK